RLRVAHVRVIEVGHLRRRREERRDAHPLDQRHRRLRPADPRPRRLPPPLQPPRPERLLVHHLPFSLLPPPPSTIAPVPTRAGGFRGERSEPLAPVSIGGAPPASVGTR